LYQRQLAQERDRLRLLLEINNQVITQLDTNELFRSASASIRKYFGNDFTGFWLIDKRSNQLECAFLDFPGSQGFLADIPVRKATEQDLEKIRSRTPEIWSQEEIEKLPLAVLERLKAESIAALAIIPLGTSNGPLGRIGMGSRRPHNFGQEDLDLLSQISAQISLALDNALAYGRLSASRNRLEDERHPSEAARFSIVGEHRMAATTEVSAPLTERGGSCFGGRKHAPGASSLSPILGASASSARAIFEGEYLSEFIDLLVRKGARVTIHTKDRDDLWIACWWWFLTTKPKRFFGHQGVNNWI
jgi:hypothetical protein